MDFYRRGCWAQGSTAASSWRCSACCGEFVWRVERDPVDVAAGEVPG
jgi:hypothetical protein